MISDLWNIQAFMELQVEAIQYILEQASQKDSDDYLCVGNRTELLNPY